MDYIVRYYHVIGLIFVVIASSISAWSPHNIVMHSKAVTKADQADWQGASEQLQALLAQQDRPHDSADLIFDTGVAAYKTGKYQEALSYFQDVEKCTDASSIVCEQAWFNAGNTAVALKQFDDAIQWYDRVLSSHPEHELARHNKQLAERLRDQQKQQEQQEQQKNQDTSKSSDKQQNQKKDQQKQNSDRNNQSDQQDNQEQSGDQDDGQSGQGSQSKKKGDQPSGDQQKQQNRSQNDHQGQQGDDQQNQSSGEESQQSQNQHGCNQDQQKGQEHAANQKRNKGQKELLSQPNEQSEKGDHNDSHNADSSEKQSSRDEKYCQSQDEHDRQQKQSGKSEQDGSQQQSDQQGQDSLKQEEHTPYKHPDIQRQYQDSHVESQEENNKPQEKPCEISSKEEQAKKYAKKRPIGVPADEQSKKKSDGSKDWVSYVLEKQQEAECQSQTARLRALASQGASKYDRSGW